MRFIELTRKNIEEAANLYVSSYERQSKETPILDPNNGKVDVIIPKLQECIEQYPSVAVVDNHKMLGYMTGIFIDELLGKHKGSYTPEWAHGSEINNSFDVYRLMYQRIGQQWVDSNCLTHAVNFMNFTKGTHEAFSWNGFGSICIDAMRPVELLDASSFDELEIRRINRDDIPKWLPMIDEHNLHLLSSPVFKPCLEKASHIEYEEWLCSKNNHAWMAFYGGEVVGYMKVAPIEDGAAWMVNGNGKFAVNGAQVKSEYRGRGIAKALLSSIMRWGIEEGFVRCSVDFEATNLEACNFWLRHFKPVCRSMVRRLDERILNCNNDSYRKE